MVPGRLLHMPNGGSAAKRYLRQHANQNGISDFHFTTISFTKWRQSHSMRSTSRQELKIKETIIKREIVESLNLLEH